MTLRPFAYVGALALLSGCFLTQKDPKPAALSTKTPISGTVAMEEMTIGNSGSIGSLYAVFGKRGTPKKRLFSHDLESMRWNRATGLSAFSPEQRAGSGDRSRATECQKLAGNKSPDGGRAEVERLSVGKLLFGPPFQQKYASLEPNSKLQYQANLEVPLPAGLYVTAAEGTEEVHGFGETTISMPEALREVRVNGGYFGDPGTQIRKTDGLHLAWRAPAIANDRNILLLDLLAEKDGRLTALRCQGFELDIATAGTSSLEWNLPASWVDHFPTGVDTEISLVRAHLFGAKNETAEVRLQGIRTHFAKVPLLP